MKATELRIGNYVHRQSGKIVVNRDDVYKIENINLQSALKYEPIPLTEEWLLKLGFEQEWKDHPQTFFQLDITDRLYFTFTIRKNYLLLHNINVLFFNKMRGISPLGVFLSSPRFV